MTVATATSRRTITATNHTRHQKAAPPALSRRKIEKPMLRRRRLASSSSTQTPQSPPSRPRKNDLLGIVLVGCLFMVTLGLSGQQVAVVVNAAVSPQKRRSSSPFQRQQRQQQQRKPPARQQQQQKKQSRPQQGPIVLTAFYRTVPQPIRYCISGGLGNFALFASEKVAAQLLSFLVTHTASVASTTTGSEIDGGGDVLAANGNAGSDLHSILTKYEHSLTFFLGYVLHIIPQHLLHATLVYGLDTISTFRKYAVTLLGTYSAMSIALVGSTVLNHYLLHTFHMEKHVAFLSTLTIFAGVNYVVIGWFVNKAVQSTAKPQKATSMGWGSSIGGKHQGRNNNKSSSRTRRS